MCPRVEEGLMTRREFGAVAAAGVWANQAQPITVKDVMERVQQNLGIPWGGNGQDTIKAGTPETPVTGIATTYMPTLDVLQRAAAARKNLIITHEPTFYNYSDQTAHLSEDAVYLRKKDVIEKNRLVIWRFHDHWHARKPDAMIIGLAKALGWENYKSSDDWRMYTMPETTLAALAAEVERKMQVKALRVIGDPKARFRKVVLYPGLSAPTIAAKMEPDFEVYVGGESTENDGGAYARDMVTAGLKKGMILMGHQVSEEPGMKECAEWLKTFIREVPVAWIPAGEGWWRP